MTPKIFHNISKWVSKNAEFENIEKNFLPKSY